MLHLRIGAIFKKNNLVLSRRKSISLYAAFKNLKQDLFLKSQ